MKLNTMLLACVASLCLSAPAAVAAEAPAIVSDAVQFINDLLPDFGLQPYGASCLPENNPPEGWLRPGGFCDKVNNPQSISLGSGPGGPPTP